MIREKDYEIALEYFEGNFSTYKSTKEFIFKKIFLCIIVLIYLKKLGQNDYLDAFKFLNNLSSEYWNKDLTISLYDKHNKLEDFNLEVIYFFNFIFMNFFLYFII